MAAAVVRKKCASSLAQALPGNQKSPGRNRCSVPQTGEKHLWRAAVNDSTDPNKNSTSNIYQYQWNGDYANPVLTSVNIAPFVGGDSLEPAASTNWQNALYKTAIVTSNDLAISAGNDKSGLLIDLGYYNNNGLMQFTNYQRYSARINSHTSAFDENFDLEKMFSSPEHPRLILPLM